VSPGRGRRALSITPASIPGISAGPRAFVPTFCRGRRLPTLDRGPHARAGGGGTIGAEGVGPTIARACSPGFPRGVCLRAASAPSSDGPHLL